MDRTQLGERRGAGSGSELMRWARARCWALGVLALCAGPGVAQDIGLRKTTKLEDPVRAVVHPVGDLLPKVEKEAAEKEGAALGPGSFVAKERVRLASDEAMAQWWRRALQDVGAKALREDESVQLQAGALIVTARESVQARLRGLLERARAARENGAFFVLETRVLSVPAGRYAERFAAVLQETKGKGHEPFVTRAGDPRHGALLKWLGSSEECKVLSEPRMVVRPASLTTLTATKEHSYLKDYQVEKLLDGTTIADPVIGRVSDGLAGLVRVLQVEEQRLLVELSCSFGELQRPIPTFTTSLGAGAPVSIQLPALTLRSVRTCVEMDEGDTVVMTLGGDESEMRVLLVRVQRAQGPAMGR